MIIQALACIVLSLAAPARADVSDSGNLTIGGQGVIQGTMTVQGAGFSVGGTTFSVAGGSVTLGGRLNAAAAGIKWADGSISTTASAAGTAGGSVLTATQTFSGANIFTSSVTVGKNVFSTAANFSQAAIGTWFLVASTRTYGGQSVQFTGLVAPYTYRVHYQLHWNTGGGFAAARINSDSGANYYNTAYGIFADGSSDSYASAGDSNARLSNTGGGASTPLTGFFELSCLLDTNVCDLHGMSNYDNSATKAMAVFNNRYVGSSGLSTLDILLSNGTWSGRIWIEAMIPPF